MSIDYDKLGRAAWMAWVDLKPAEFNRQVGGEKIARAVIRESGLLEEVERLRSNLINAVNALENVGRHKGLLAGERAALEDAKAALNSPLNPEGLRDQTGIENKAWKE